MTYYFEYSTNSEISLSIVDVFDWDNLSLFPSSFTDLSCIILDDDYAEINKFTTTVSLIDPLAPVITLSGPTF